MDDALDAVRAVTSGRYWGLLGIEYLEAERGRTLCRIDLREEHLNYNDVVHGGVISGLIDSAAGGAVRTLRSLQEITERPHATSDLHVTYLSAASGTALVAEARTVRIGRTAIFTEVDVRDDRDRLVARGMVTFVIGQGPPVRRD